MRSDSRLGGRIERLQRLGVQHLDLGAIDRRRGQAIEIFDRAAAGDPAVADAEPDMESGEMIGAAGLRQAGGEQPRNVGSAIRAGAHAHLGHLIERVIGRLAEHVGLGFAAELAEEIIHPLHFAVDEHSRMCFRYPRHVEIHRVVALFLFGRHGARDARHVGLDPPSLARSPS